MFVQCSMFRWQSSSMVFFTGQFCQRLLSIYLLNFLSSKNTPKEVKCICIQLHFQLLWNKWHSMQLYNLNGEVFPGQGTGLNFEVEDWISTFVLAGLWSQLPPWAFAWCPWHRVQQGGWHVPRLHKVSSAVKSWHILDIPIWCVVW